jgi:molybdopterin converting factor small subunit
MQVTVHYLAQLKRAAGCSAEVVLAPDEATLRELIRMLAERHGHALGPLLLDESDQPSHSLLFFVGEEHAELTRRLRDGDAVTILTPMSGG